MATEDTKTADTSDDKRQSLGNSKSRYLDNLLPMVNSLILFYLLTDALITICFQARIKKIMKMDPNITDNIANEANYMICTATEYFVRYLAKEAYNLDNKALSYQSLAQYVQDEEKLDFLHQVW